MRRPDTSFHLALCILAAVFYVLNLFWLRQVTSGWLLWFLTCYANDVVAGLAIVAWFNLLLRWGRLPALRSWKWVVLFLLACSLVWEVLAPLWKEGAVFDLWDFAAYQVGGICYLLLCRLNAQEIK